MVCRPTFILAQEFLLSKELSSPCRAGGLFLRPYKKSQSTLPGKSCTLRPGYKNHGYYIRIHTDLQLSLIHIYNLVVSGKDYYVYLVTNEEEIQVLEQLHKFDKTLPDIGLKMKTGLTVDFRNRDILRDTEEEGAIPLFYSQHIKQGKVQFPINKEHEYVVTDQKGLMQENRNYLFVKRFTAKEEHRRLQCGVYLAKNYPQYSKISTQNKINFIDGLLHEMSECLVYGLYVIFNSTLYDEYYRILNGSTQVNSTEINAMPVPDLESIREMGRKLMKSKDLSEKNCNLILEGYCG